MISVSSHAWERMGYRKLGEDEVLIGRFSRLLVYHVEGFKIEQAIVGPLNHIFDGEPCTFAIGESVNDLSQILVGDDFVEDEVAWQKGVATIGPYLVIKIGPTAEYATTATHVRKEGDEIWTGGGFERARAELDKMQDRIAPLVVSTLTVAFTSSTTIFRFVAGASYGVAISGERIRDMRFSMNGYAIVSKLIDGNEVLTTVQRALERSCHLDRKVAGFYDLALKEAAATKQFLLFFVTLELLTKIEFTARYPAAVNTGSGAALPKKDRQKLEHQFSWLQKHALTSLSQQCVDRFQRLRKTRNSIAHGVIASVASQDVQDIKTLTTEAIASAMAL